MMIYWSLSTQPRIHVADCMAVAILQAVLTVARASVYIVNTQYMEAEISARHALIRACTHAPCVRRTDNTPQLPGIPLSVSHVFLRSNLSKIVLENGIKMVKKL